MFFGMGFFFGCRQLASGVQGLRGVIVGSQLNPNPEPLTFDPTVGAQHVHGCLVLRRLRQILQRRWIDSSSIKTHLPNKSNRV